MKLAISAETYILNILLFGFKGNIRTNYDAYNQKGNHWKFRYTSFFISYNHLSFLGTVLFGFFSDFVLGFVGVSLILKMLGNISRYAAFGHL